MSGPVHQPGVIIHLLLLVTAALSVVSHMAWKVNPSVYVVWCF